MPDNTIKPRNKVKIKITKKVTTAYIAKIEEEYLTSTGTYDFKFKKNRKTSTKYLRKKVAKRILRNNDFKGTILKQITDVLKTKSLYKSGESIKIPYYKRKISFAKIDKAKLYDEVYIVVETEELQNGEVIVELRQGEKQELEAEGVAIYVRQNKNDIKEIKANIGDFAKDESIENKDDFKNLAIAKIELFAKNKKNEEYSKFLKEATDKKAHLYLLVKANVSGDSFTNTFYEEVNGKIANRWYDGDAEGVEWFKLNYSCGYYQFRCVSPYSMYGPLYKGNIKLKDYHGWNKLIKDNKITSDEKEILIAMSENEANIDGVQSYDSEVLSAGTMQKTVNKVGKGEFPIQVEEFKKDFPVKYKTLFEECGWTVENKKIYYKNPFDKDAKKVTGNDLKKLIRKDFSKYNQEKKLNCSPLVPIVKAIKDPDFQNKQVTDFISRLNNIVLTKRPKGHTTYKLKDYLKSKLGKATALDHHVNRPGHVSKYFGVALDYFYTTKDKEVADVNIIIIKENKEITDPKLKKKKKEKISRNPNDWGSKHNKYEKEVLEIYGPLRGEAIPSVIKKYAMTDAKLRYNKLKKKIQ